MKIVYEEEMNFKKGQIYGVDALQDLNVGFPFKDYFYSEDEPKVRFIAEDRVTYEWGSLMCKKNFSFKIIVKG